MHDIVVVVVVEEISIEFEVCDYVSIFVFDGRGEDFVE